MTKRESIIVLLSITLCWSSSYLFIKDVPEGLSDFAYLALTSGVAGILLAVVFFRLLPRITGRLVRHTAILSMLITGNMLFERMALVQLPASTVSALAAMNIVIVPIILMLRREFPTRNNVVGILVIVIGIIVSSYSTARTAIGSCDRRTACRSPQASCWAPSGRLPAPWATSYRIGSTGYTKRRFWASPATSSWPSCPIRRG